LAAEVGESVCRNGRDGYGVELGPATGEPAGEDWIGTNARSAGSK
jgi:hypothetical protein